MDETDRPENVLIVIVTDGEENSSKDWINSTIKDLITQQQTKYSWTFVYLGANQDSFSVAGQYGILAAANYNPTPKGVTNIYAGVSASTTNLRTTGTFSQVPDQSSERE
jgi:hypothetical protein